MTEERHKEAARGYLFLKMPQEALEEIKSLDSSIRTQQEVLDLALAAEMMLEDWNAAAATAGLLCNIDPNQSRYFIHAAYCLHEVGDTEKAKQLLLSGPKELLDEPLFHYNMACYLATLNQPKNALHYLNKSFELDETLREVAANDSDLKELTW